MNSHFLREANVKASADQSTVGLAQSFGVNFFEPSADNRRMRDLLYRLPRFTADFPVDVIVGEVAILGVCKDISDTGMRGEFRHGLPVNTEGLIRLNHPQQILEVKGRVTFWSQYSMSFYFLCQSDAEKKKLCDFARLATVIGSSLKKAALPVRGLRYLPSPPDKRFL